MVAVNEITSLIENGQLEKAMSAYREILEQGNDEEKFLLSEELFRFGFMEETETLIESLLKNYPEEGELHVLLAETRIELGKEEEAMLTLEKVDKDDPAFPQALLLLADLYQMEGLYEVSENKLLEAKRILPDESVIDFALGELYAHQGKLAEAIQYYETVLKVHEEIGGVNINQRLAETLSAGGSFEEALHFYDIALEQKLEINTLFGYAFTALQAGYNKTAIEKFEELKTLDPEYHSLYLYLAKAYEREEMAEEAFEAVKQGIEQDEYNKDLYFYGGKLALKLPDEDTAEKLIREAIALDPGFMEGVLVLNKLLLKQERYEDVLELIGAADYNEEEEPQILWDAAIAYQHIEDYSQALNKYQLAYTFFKDNKEFLSDYGYFLIEEGKMGEAAEILSMLVEKEPGNEEFREMLERLTENQ
ncbi:MULTISPECIES: tetratricopeptide repeat protein [Bacillaceae]|uniref:tetratricopeptide repeat protein n=1 Tax=Bacillaceae TaxID=186817 RepID=UPI0011A5C00E|nr:MULTISPECIES: tetratricopeptide repeat protein [Bacillaceae]MCM3122189.1 tetratricopeptide repeat protein [Mesobacillus sp. MER 33]MCM3232153.1 tetratricopeptide repeat protein [Mesobacillus sp. MER 48]